MRIDACCSVLLLVVFQLLAAWTNTAQSGVTMCYYGSWATYRSGNGKCEIEDLNPNLCTHYIYSFAGLDGTTNKIMSIDSWVDINLNGLTRFGALKQINPALKTLIAIGGWNEGSYKFSQMAATSSKRTTFIASVVAFIKQYNFDGLDVDWEYPSGGDLQTYVLLLKELRTEFDKYGYILTIAVGAGKWTMDNGYDFPNIHPHVDYINVMNYDYHGSWESATGHVAPLYARPDESPDNKVLNVDYTITYILNKGVPSGKIVMGMPMYGVAFTLSNPSVNGLYASVNSPGYPGPYTQQDGFLGYNEICEKIQNGGWTVVRDNISKAPRAYRDNQWVGYDDPQSITDKVNYAKSLNLGGGMVWSIETDDFRGICGSAYPLLTIINQGFTSGSSQTTTTTTAPVTTTTTATTTTKTPTTTATVGTTTTTPGTTTTSAQTTTTTTAGTTTTTSSGAGGSQNYVLSRCSEGKLIRDQADCTVFYQCVDNGKGGYNTIKSTCGAGLAFDEVIQACNWRESVSC